MEKMTTIPHFIEAKTPAELQKLMLKNNLSSGYFYRYFDIKEMSNGRWIVWYFKNIDNNTILSGGDNANDRR